MLRTPLLCLGLLFILFPAMAQPELDSNTKYSTDGSYRLSWNADNNHVELQEASSNHFQKPRTVYKGTDSATVVSGKSNGKWYYRVRNQNQPHWSKILVVTVEHHQLSQAFFFLGIGFVVFMATLLMITFGSRQAD